ncbi:Uncharacterised protein [Mycobacteroides abscessus subsp. abscessus]|nr:Uncharacterised protein [Mycobacteroides abscessus subsp. abscessus]
MSLAHNSGSPRKSMGVTLTVLMARHIGTMRNPIMPMSWNSGSQLTTTSVSGSAPDALTMARRLASILR